LGPVALHALGGLKYVNELNIENEVEDYLYPLSRQLGITSERKYQGVHDLKDIKFPQEKFAREAQLYEMLHGKTQDLVSDTDSTTHNSEVHSQATQEDCEEMHDTMSLKSETTAESDFVHHKTDLKKGLKIPDVPIQFKSGNKW
jgi:hypothetical protein